MSRKIKPVVTKVSLHDQPKDSVYWRKQPYHAHQEETGVLEAIQPYVTAA